MVTCDTCKKTFKYNYLSGMKDIGSEYYEGSSNSVIKEFIENVEYHF